MSVRHRFASATVALGVVLGLGVGVAQAQTMRINHTFGVDSFPDQALKTFAKGVQDRTDGAITVTLFSAGELGQELEQYDLMEVGALECALMGAQILASVAPEYGAFEMPYLWRDQAHVRNVWSGPIGQEIASTILDRKGIRVIAVLNRGARNLTVNKAVKTPADFQGLKIRTTQNAVHVAAWEAMGAVPTP
ncbi:MAG: TRAP transporter substrate-binding protein, partial [bacterium]